MEHIAFAGQDSGSADIQIDEFSSWADRPASFAAMCWCVVPVIVDGVAR